MPATNVCMCTMLTTRAYIMYSTHSLWPPSCSHDYRIYYRCCHRDHRRQPYYAPSFSPRIRFPCLPGFLSFQQKANKEPTKTQRKPNTTNMVTSSSVSEIRCSETGIFTISEQKSTLPGKVRFSKKVTLPGKVTLCLEQGHAAGQS